MNRARANGMHCDAIKVEELHTVTRDLPVQLWNSPAASHIYGATLNLVCFSRQGTAVGVWVCPLDGQDPPTVRRASRLFPYASPWVDPELHPVMRHRVVGSMTEALMVHTGAADLPMDPQFSEVAALLEAGASVLCRHTRLLDTVGNSDLRASYLPTARNHIRAAGKRHTVEPVQPDMFDFTRAIVGQSAKAVAARRRAGLEISRENPTLCLAAMDGDGVCRGQAFVLRAGNTAILMHSWFDGARGVPSLLIDEAISRSVKDLETTVFDFEGSVIPGIDRFMAGFGARAAAYPQVRWQRSMKASVEFG